MILWPSSLQQLLNASSWSYDFGETNLRSNMDTGAPKVRRRFTHRIDTMSCTIDLHKDDYDVFDSFYSTSLSMGSLQFKYKHPLTNEENTMWRFSSPPKISYLGGEYYRLQMAWELIP